MAPYHLQSATPAPHRALSLKKTHYSNRAHIHHDLPPPERRHCTGNHTQQIAPQRPYTRPRCHHCPFTGRKLTPQHQQICHRRLHDHLRREPGKFLRHKNHQNHRLGGSGAQRMVMPPHKSLTHPPGPHYHQPQHGHSHSIQTEQPQLHVHHRNKPDLPRTCSTPNEQEVPPGVPPQRIRTPQH